MNKNSSCECCGEENWNLWLNKEGARYLRCGVCGLGKTEQIPTSEILFSIYEDFAKNYYLGAEKKAIDKAIDHSERLHSLEMYKQNSRLLDVGCSTGGFLHQAKAKGWKAYGVDISPTVCQVARMQDLEVFSGSIHEAKYPDNFFDVVRIWANLEHVPDPYQCIVESFRILRKGGILIFSVPSVESLMVRLLKTHYRYIVPEHLYYFSQRAIRRILSRVGFSVLKLESKGFDFFPFFEDLKGKPANEINTSHAVIAERSFVSKTKKSWVFKPLKYAHSAFQWCLTRMNLGENWYAYARKPD